MNPASADDAAFLRDLVKVSRQKTHLVKWVDRDGSDRHTSLTRAEAGRLGELAQREKTSSSELLRCAAHVPVRASTAP
jgi:Ribbon-helix-helix protein, copG family